MSTQTNIMQFDLPSLKQLLKDKGEKPFRALQICEWLYLRGATSFDEMVNIPQSLRTLLTNEYYIAQPEVVTKATASDGTTRFLLRLHDGELTETVAIPSQKRLTVCFSTQAGCALGCVFCATGSLGLSRSLLPGEMLAQLSIVASVYNDTRISNIVAMGQGEPFANYDATLSALRMMNDPKLFGVGARHITISTAGLLRQIRRLANEPEQFTLAVSLHSAVQRTRNRLMPGLSTQPIDELKSTLLDYMAITSRRPTVEYALIDGINDSKEELASLLAFCKVPQPGFHVNLITLNTISNPPEGMPLLKPATKQAFALFESKLAKAGISVTHRASKGEDIAAACGQLASQEQ